MDALIHLVSSSPRLALLDVAGKPLLVRQVQWLRAAGCERIAVELPSGDLGLAITAALAAEPLGPDVLLLTTTGAPPRELALDPSLHLSTRVLLLPADVLGDGDLVRTLLSAGADEVEIELRSPGERLDRLAGATARLIGPTSQDARQVRGPGWGVRLHGEDDAFWLSLAILDGALSCHASSVWAVQVHASRIRSGVWVARGAVVHRSALLVRPVFIGPGAIVEQDAVVGPGVLVGPDAVIGSSARLLAAAVEARSRVPAEAEVSGARIVPTLASHPRHGVRRAALALAALVAVALSLLVLRQTSARAAAHPLVSGRVVSLGEAP